MARTPRRLGQVLAGAGFAAEVQTFVVNINNTTTADATFRLFRVPRKCRVRKITYSQTADATAATTFTVKIRKATGPTDLTAALNIKLQGANYSADMALSSTVADLVIPAGEVLQAFFDETGGTVTAPGIVGIAIEVQLL